MKILIVNDDSIAAPGIQVLARTAAKLGEVWVAAPAEQCSALSQKLTLRELIPVEEVTDFPVPVRRAWRIGGTPVDCVKVALEYLMEERPDVILSGINNGFNAGQDIAYSGMRQAVYLLWRKLRRRRILRRFLPQTRVAARPFTTMHTPSLIVSRFSCPCAARSI